MKILAFLGAASGFIGVAAGAFGAHTLRERLEPRALEIFETAAHYQLIHALAIVVAAVLAARAAPQAATAGWCFVAGTAIFSGSLYALALTGVTKLGAITPVGGLLFLAGWALLAWSAWQA